MLNLPKPLSDFVTMMGVKPDAVFNHVVSILHSPAYRSENLGALRMDWPRVPIPGDSDRLTHSSILGDALSLLLNPETPTPGVSTSVLRPGLRVLGLPVKRGGAALEAADLALTAGWGSTQNAGGGNIVA
jgi:type ISP restriction-modification system protein